MGNPLAGNSSDVWVTSTPSVSATNESCTDSGDHITYIASVHVFWDFSQTFTVQNSPNGSSSWTTVTDYTVQWAAGRIVFNTARTPGVNNFTRISAGNYFPVTQLDASHAWDLSQKMATKDTTAFQATGNWASFTPTLKSASGKIDTYRNDNRLATELGNMLGVQLYVDKANNIRWQFYAMNTGVEPKVDVNNVETQSFSFVSTKDIYLLTT
jgi:hypothetical protein